MSARVARAALSRRQRLSIALLLLLLALAALLFALRDTISRKLVLAGRPGFEPLEAGAPLAPNFDDLDADRRQIRIGMETVARGIEQPTDIQFPPGVRGYAVVLEKTGRARWLKLDTGTHGELFRIEVQTRSEQGLLGLAFHPGFADNGRLFVNYVARTAGPKGQDVTRVAEWRIERAENFAKSKAKPVAVLLEVEQPYPNHNAGALAFGPDGYLYVGLGDGGAGGDPHGHGQNLATLLGSMLRIDVSGGSDGRPYRIPADNPFVGRSGVPSETWAYGLRNPWRYSFDPKGRLVVADVGQNAWEEVDIVQAGDNLGWDIREGFSCFGSDAACARADLVDPVFVYGRDEGVSITGGYVYTGTRIAALRGSYVFGDFASGKLFAIALPDDRRQRVKEPIALGRWPIMPTTFGRDHDGELYVGDFRGGRILRFVPAAP